MAISVFHAENFVYPVLNEKGDPVLDANGTALVEDRYGNAPVYRHVAEVDLDDEDYARVYELTNSIDWPWWENEGVAANFDSPAFFEVEGREGKGTRSTSVGDLIMLSDGRWLRCASVGWVEVSTVPPSVFA